MFRLRPHRSILLVSASALTMSILGAARSSATDCVPQWDFAPGQPGMNDRVSAMTVFDDGSGGGPALVVAGRFTMAGGAPVSLVAKWTGTAWQPFGANLPISEVLALAVYDRGSGPELYLAGGAPTSVARWDASQAQWLAVPNAPSSWIGALYAYDDGGGPQLYVSGGFGFFPTVEGHTEYIARWDGRDWHSVGDGLISVVHQFATFDDGSGTALYAVGGFGFAGSGGSPTVVGFGRFDGRTWSGAGGGFDTGAVFALTAHDDGAGLALYAAGDFAVAGGTSTNNGGIEANRIARWNGQQWSTLGAGLNATVHALQVFDEDGDGPNPPSLFAAGDFTMAGGIVANHIARWDGSTWSAVGDGVNGSARTLGLSPNGGTLFVGGDFALPAPGSPGNHIAAWTCQSSRPAGDVNGDGHVDVDDLVAVILGWGACPAPPALCPADVAPVPDGDGEVDVDDLIVVILNWG